jgi:hypothetical protein
MVLTLSTRMLHTTAQFLFISVFIGSAFSGAFAAGVESASVSSLGVKKYVFDPEVLSKIGVEAHQQANRNLKYDPDDLELRTIQEVADSRQAPDFEKAMITRLGSSAAYQALIQTAFDQYPGLKGSVVDNKGDGIFLVRKPNGQRSIIHPRELLFGYHFEETVRILHQMLKDKYPGQILDEIARPWNNVGGVFAQILIFSCSTNEYLAGFFTASEVPHGFSGVYPTMDVYDIMFSGEMTTNNSKNPIERFPQGFYSHLDRKDSWVYSMSSYTGMLDLGQGNVVANFWQGIIAPAIFNNHDFGSMNSQIRSCAKSIFTRAWLRLGLGKK